MLDWTRTLATQANGKRATEHHGRDATGRYCAIVAWFELDRRKFWFGRAAVNGVVVKTPARPDPISAIAAKREIAVLISAEMTRQANVERESGYAETKARAVADAGKAREHFLSLPAGPQRADFLARKTHGDLINQAARCYLGAYCGMGPRSQAYCDAWRAEWSRLVLATHAPFARSVVAEAARDMARPVARAEDTASEADGCEDMPGADSPVWEDMAPRDARDAATAASYETPEAQRVMADEVEPDRNGAMRIAGWDIQQTGADDWRASIIDSHGDYLENEYFETKAAAFAHARNNPR